MLEGRPQESRQDRALLGIGKALEHAENLDVERLRLRAIEDGIAYSAHPRLDLVKGEEAAAFQLFWGLLSVSEGHYDQDREGQRDQALHTSASSLLGVVRSITFNQKIRQRASYHTGEIKGQAYAGRDSGWRVELTDGRG